ncbi:MAG: hypothetical protein GY929_21065 [Actinomycetia bacterium]|nr:hypothetical protein [Actinomycetes bacterium]
MLIVCWSWKGGVGTSVSVAGLALSAPSPGSLVVDLAGDQAALFGLPESDGPDLSHWLDSVDAPVDGLARLERAVTDGVSLSTGSKGLGVPFERLRLLAEVLSADSRRVVVDAGRLDPADPLPPLTRALVDRTDQALVVTRACYLALRNASGASPRPTGVILCVEAGRVLGVDDVAASVGAPVVARVPVEPAIARAVDAGLLSARPPRGFLRALQPVMA